MSTLSPPERPRRNIALIVSICVNLVLAGIIAMAVFRMSFHAPVGVFLGGPAGSPGQMERSQVRQMMSPRVLMRAAPDKRDALRNVMQAHRDRIEPMKTEALESRREVLRVYAAPTIDKVALDRAFARMQRADAALETEITKLSAEAGALLTSEQRQAVLAWKPHDGGTHGGGGGRRGHDHGPRVDP